MDNEEEEQRQQPIEQLPQDLALDDEEEGINIELGKLPSYLDDNNDCQSSNNGDDNEEEDANAMLAADAPPQSSSSTQRASSRRRNQLLTMLAIFAVLCIFALSIGFGVGKARSSSSNNSESAYIYNDEAVITSSAMEALDTEDTETPTSSPVAPLYMSNDY